MSRAMIQESISEEHALIYKYSDQILSYLKENCSDKVIEEVIAKVEEIKNERPELGIQKVNSVEIAINMIKNSLLNNKSIYLLMNKLFNKRGRKSKTQNSKDMIDVLIESVVFDLLMEKKQNKKEDNIKVIQEEFRKISKKTLRISILPEYSCEDDYYYKLEESDEVHYNTKDRAKNMFHLYVINILANKEVKLSYKELSKTTKKTILDYIKTSYKSTSKYAEMVFLIYLSKFIDMICHSSIAFFNKIEYLYSLKEYQESLCSIVYTMILQIKEDKDFEDALEEYKNFRYIEEDAAIQLERIRRNIPNREKSMKSEYIADFILDAIRIADEDGDSDTESTLVKEYLKALIDTVDTWKDEKQKKRIIRDFDKINYNMKDFSDKYQRSRRYLPQCYLEREDILHSDIRELLRWIKKCKNNESSQINVYIYCYEIYSNLRELFLEISLFNKEKNSIVIKSEAL